MGDLLIELGFVRVFVWLSCDCIVMSWLIVGRGLGLNGWGDLFLID